MMRTVADAIKEIADYGLETLFRQVKAELPTWETMPLTPEKEAAVQGLVTSFVEYMRPAVQQCINVLAADLTTPREDERG